MTDLKRYKQASEFWNYIIDTVPPNETSKPRRPCWQCAKCGTIRWVSLKKILMEPACNKCQYTIQDYLYTSPIWEYMGVPGVQEKMGDAVYNMKSLGPGSYTKQSEKLTEIPQTIYNEASWRCTSCNKLSVTTYYNIKHNKFQCPNCPKNL